MTLVRCSKCLVAVDVDLTPDQIMFMGHHHSFKRDIFLCVGCQDGCEPEVVESAEDEPKDAA